MDYRPIRVKGGVIIEGAAGGVNLSDFFTGEDTTLDIVDQDIASENATLYITLRPSCLYFFCEQVSIGYVDTAAADDLAELYLMEGPDSTAIKRRTKVRWSDTDGIAESTLPVITDVNKGFDLDTAGRLYFMTNWTTQVINCGGATEYFLLRVDGYTTHRVP